MGIKAKVAKLLSFVRVVRNGGNVSDVKIDPGGGANITPEHFHDSGDDSHPLPQDYPIAVPLEREGVFSVVGYTDPENEPKTLPGGKRIYGRDENGTEVNEVWCKNDGTIFINNGVGSTEIKPDGKITTTNSKGTNTIEPGGQIKSENENGSVTIKESGDIESVNAGGSIKLTPAGVMTTEATIRINLTAPLIVLSGGIQLNGPVSGASGGDIESTVDFHTTKTITADTDVIAGTKSGKTHSHNINSGSSAPGPTDGPN